LSAKTFVFDLDGVVYRGKMLLPGVVDTISTLRQSGHKVYFFTNNSTKTRTSFVRKLEKMGIPADEEHMMTSSYATALYLQEQGASEKSVYIVGEEGIRVELEAVGMKIAEDGVSDRVDYVVVGLDRGFCYEKMLNAQQAIFRGAEFIATNRDVSFPAEGGMITPGAGTMVAAIQAATGVEPLVIAKPQTTAMYQIMEMAHSTPEDTIVIGDRLDTDVLVGRRVGAQTVLVLTGVHTEEDVKSAPPEMHPDIIIRTLPELLCIYKESRKP
jgi:4-nitrophenyl phosphatase